MTVVLLQLSLLERYNGSRISCEDRATRGLRQLHPIVRQPAPGTLGPNLSGCCDVRQRRRTPRRSPDCSFRPVAIKKTMDRGEENFGRFYVWEMTDAFQLKESRVRHRGGPFTGTVYRQRIKLTLDDQRRHHNRAKRCRPIPVTERGEGKLVNVLLVPEGFL